MVWSFNLSLLSALSRLITTLKESDNLSNDQEIDFLKALLESKELNALVNVHTKVAKVGRDERLAPVLSTSAQVLYEVLEQLSQRCHLSDDCKEAFHLLQDSHVQVPRLQSIDNVIVPKLNLFLLTAFTLCTRCHCTEGFLSASARGAH